MTAAHTPGPWIKRGDMVFAHRKIGDGRHGPNEESLLSLARDPEERDANARLIAAAPEMYEALKAALRCPRIYDTDQDTGETPHALITAALARAERGTS